MESPCSQSRLNLQPWARVLQKYQITAGLSTLGGLCQLSQGQASRALSVRTIQLSLNHTLPQLACCFMFLSSALPTQTQVPHVLKLNLRFPSSLNERKGRLMDHSLVSIGFANQCVLSLPSSGEDVSKPPSNCYSRKITWEGLLDHIKPSSLAFVYQRKIAWYQDEEGRNIALF